jgi:hypothetical protein
MDLKHRKVDLNKNESFLKWFLKKFGDRNDKGQCYEARPS